MCDVSKEKKEVRWHMTKEGNWFKTLVTPVVGGVVGGFVGTIIGNLSFVPLTSTEWGPICFLIGLLFPFIAKKD